MTIRSSSLLACALVAFGGCAPDATSPAARTAEVTVTTTEIPADGTCTHIVTTRLSDFQVAEYKGPLAGARLRALVGDNRVTATAYPQPCGSEPASAPWIADEQIATFANGANTLRLAFKRNVDVAVDPVFDPDPAPLVVRPGSLVRASRNGEDAAGPNFSLDGWEVKQIAVPPASPSETVLFSLIDQGLPYAPRGMAHLPDGRFVFQLSEPASPLYVFDATGAPLGTWPVTSSPTLLPWTTTDGFEAIDATHFVRTGWSESPLGCDAQGNNCVHAGLDILEATTAADGSTSVRVTAQVRLPTVPGAPLADEYPVAVAPVGNRFAVVTLPAGGSRLAIVNADGTLAAGPTSIAGDVEGLFDDGAGRLVAIDYTGVVQTYNTSDATPRAGEQATYSDGLNLGTPPTAMAWRSAGAGSFLVLTSDSRLHEVTPGFDAASDVPLDLGTFVTMTGMDYRADTDEVLLMDRFPSDGAPFPAVRAYNLATHALDATVALQTGLSQPLAAITLGWISSTHQLVANFRASDGSADPTLDAVAFVFNLDGTRAAQVDLRGLGIARIRTVGYRAASDELVFVVNDESGRKRLLLTDRAGAPHRSYTLEALPGFVDAAPIESGPFTGDLGAATGEPSFLARIALP